jgi:hypothetical protein
VVNEVLKLGARADAQDGGRGRRVCHRAETKGGIGESISAPMPHRRHIGGESNASAAAAKAQAYSVASIVKPMWRSKLMLSGCAFARPQKSLGSAPFAPLP